MEQRWKEREARAASAAASIASPAVAVALFGAAPVKLPFSGKSKQRWLDSKGYHHSTSCPNHGKTGVGFRGNCAVDCPRAVASARYF